MDKEAKIRDVQGRLAQHEIDGWLLYDFQKSNDLAYQFLEIPPEKHLTRRFFYWIPAHGQPVQIVHEIESHALDHLPGEKRVYLKWQTLESLLQEVLKSSRVVAMEYSPRCSVPYISKVDAGTFELVRQCDVEVVSSAPFLQVYTSVLNPSQRNSLEEAAQVLEQAVDGVWCWIAKKLSTGEKIVEYDVQQWILDFFEQADCMTGAPPHCAVNAHSADPHFSAKKEGGQSIEKGDFILIDLWCKKKMPGAIYADVTKVAIASSAPTQKQQQIFSIVREAQKVATDFIRHRFEQQQVVKGFEVDEVCRQVIQEAGYGDFYPHRTGHNIGTDLHGAGTHLDSLETFDDRPILPGTCFSIEPGIYLPGEFGLRLEYNVYVTLDGQIEIFGGKQDAIKTLF